MAIFKLSTGAVLFEFWPVEERAHTPTIYRKYNFQAVLLIHASGKLWGIIDYLSDAHFGTLQHFGRHPQVINWDFHYVWR